MAGLGSALLSLAISHQVRAEVNEGSVRALALCELGVAQAMYELGRDEDVDGDDFVGSVAGAGPSGDYEVAGVQADRRHFTLTAHAANRDASRDIEVLVWAKPTTYFTMALAGIDNVTVGGGFTTDSYDSLDGTYESQAVHTDENGVPYAKAFGNISSNGSLSIGGSTVTIHGSAAAGPGEEPEISGDPTITGGIEPLDEPLDLPIPSYDEFYQAYLDNDNAAIPTGRGVTYDPVNLALVVDGNATLNFPPGTYFFTSLTIAGNAVLQFNAETRIYLTGNLDAAGGTITNLTELARNLTIIAYPYPIPLGFNPPRPQELALAGGASTALTVYAPAADVSISGGADLYGAIVGRAVYGNGCSFHYDESLGYEEDIEFQPYVRVAWRELGRPAD